MNIKDKAKEFAIKAHIGQVRKSEQNKPMIIHPINVAYILEEYGFDDNVIAAGYLQDVVEDTKYTITDIKKEFGSDIASLVNKASEQDKTLSWEERKTETINKLKELDFRHKAVVIADKINNLEDLDRLLNTKENFTFNNFNRGYEKQKWYYTNLSNEIIKNENHEIFTRFKNLVDKVFNNKKDIATNYLNKDRYKELSNIHYLKKEIKNILNCINIKPYVIEFTGTPRTGKTSIINNLEDFFKKAGYKVKVLEEFTTSKFYKDNLKKQLAKEYKNIINQEIPKYVNIQLEESLKEDYDLIIIDRSLFDRCIWIDRLKLKNGISDEEVSNYYNKYIPIIKEKINLVISTYCDSKIAMKRDYESNLALEERTFLNINNLNEYNISLKNTIKLFEENNYKINFFNTNNKELRDIEYEIVKLILNKLYTKSLNELQQIYK